MPRLVSIVLVAASVLALGFADDPPGMSPFASFDRAYIPALALSKMQKAEPSAKAMERLLAQWEAGRRSLAAALGNDEGAKQGLAEVEATIQAGNELIETGDLKGAHEKLEGARVLLRELRRSKNIAYDVDLLVDFHDTMEEIVKPYMGKTPADLTAADLEAIGGHTETALAQWRLVEQAPFHKELYGFTDEDREGLAQAIAAQRGVLDTIQKSKAAGEKEGLLAAVRVLQPTFAAVYTRFGAFPGGRPQFMP